MTDQKLGKFIAFEGGEGSGKSTQARRLCERLNRQGIRTVLTREPGGTPNAEAIRTMLVEGEPNRWTPRAELLLFFAARAEHVETFIKPHLKEGVWVISDRFIGSSIAYQGYGRELGIDVVTQIAAYTIELIPDIEFILDLPVEEGLKRAQARGTASTFERLPVEFHERLRKGYQESSVAVEPHLIDALCLIEEIEQSVWSIMQKSINEPSNG